MDNNNCYSFINLFLRFFCSCRCSSGDKVVGIKPRIKSVSFHQNVRIYEFEKVPDINAHVAFGLGLDPVHSKSYESKLEDKQHVRQHREFFNQNIKFLGRISTWSQHNCVYISRPKLFGGCSCIDNCYLNKNCPCYMDEVPCQKHICGCNGVLASCLNKHTLENRLLKYAQEQQQQQQQQQQEEEEEEEEEES